MAKKIILLICFTLGYVYVAQAQRYNFPDSPTDFITYASEQLQKTGKAEIISTADVFKALWEGGKISASQKERVIKICQKLAPTRATIAAEYHDLFRSIFNGLQERKISSSQLDNFLSVSEELVEAKVAANIKSFFETTRGFLIGQTLHANKFSKLYAIGDFSFEFIKDMEAARNEFTVSTEGEVSNDELPSIAGAVIRFKNTEIVFVTPFDSTGIHKTEGIFVISNNQFVGKGGSFNWQSVELDPTAVFCQFYSYAFDVTKPVLNVKNARLNYTIMLSKTLLGDFEFVSRARKSPQDAKYPRFISYDADVLINQFGKDLSYQGGFCLEGINIFSNSTNPNQLSIITGESPLGTAFRIRSPKFLITDSLVTASQVSMSIYLGGEQDSLYHSNLQFKLYRENRIIQMIRDRNTSAANTPFINSYHQFYIDADVVSYNLEKDSLDIFMLSGAQNLRPALFESFDFFNQQRYNEMVGLYDFHPIKLFTKYAEKLNSIQFTAQDMAKDLRRNEGTIRVVANDLQSRGYLTYDSNTGNIELGKRILQTDSANLFIEAVERTKAKTVRRTDSLIYDIYDHDNFLIQSSVSGGPNASLTRQDNELLIRGIESFPMSVALNVNIIPDPTLKRVKVYGGRNLYMEKGEITVGNFRFIGKNFFLLYNDFTLEMPEIDKILFAIQDTTEDTNGQRNEYGAEISFGAGNMQINDHLNKSGRKKGKIKGTGDYYESFPKLNIPMGGDMYFATDYRKAFSYDSSRVYFKIDEIDMDSLNTKIPVFPGKFVSNIFPVFKDQLVPMRPPDFSMGFTHTPPATGYKLYPESNDVKGAHIKFNRSIVMNRDGLFSGGEINYLTTTLTAPEYYFMPDSVTSDNIDFIVKEGKKGRGEFAQATGTQAQLEWYINDDNMEITNRQEIVRLEDAKSTLAEGVFEQRYRDKLFTLYENIEPTTLNGNLYITSSGLKGEGNLTRKDFSILSVSDEPFEFGITNFSGSNVEFRINSKDRDPYEYDKGYFYNENKAVLLGNFVDFEFDLSKGKSSIRPDLEFGDFASLSLPYSEYRTSIKEAIWDLKKKNITMTGDSTSYFTSTIFGSEDYNQENLRFQAPSAFYDITSLSMKVEGVPFINSADASIVPKDGEVIILKDAEMQELNEAIVLIDTLNRYHRLFNGHIRIKSRFEFEGDATYQFVNVQNDTFNVKFDKFELIEPENTTKAERRKGSIPKFTFAQGTVAEEDNFYITSRVLYKGGIKMYANRKDLSLDGFIKLDLSTRSDFNEWIPYKSDKGDEVFLELDEKRKVDDQTITSGLHYASGAVDLYTTFLSPKQSEADQDIFLASGVLDYNPSINEFKVSPQIRRDGKSYTGNQLIFDDSQASIFVEGLFKLVDEALSKIIKTSGSGRLSIKDKSYKFDLMMPVNLPIEFKSVSLMQAAIIGKMPEKPITLMKGDPLITKIAEIAGEKEFKKFEESIGTRPIPIPEISKDLKVPFVFSKVNLNWSDEYKTYYSEGPLHLLSIFEKIIDENVTGFIEIHKSAEGDVFTMYLQPDPDIWYYFETSPVGIVSALSSDDGFNDVVAGKTVELAGVDKKEAFINKFRAIYNAPELPKKKAEENPEEIKTPEKEKKDDGF